MNTQKSTIASTDAVCGDAGHREETCAQATAKQKKRQGLLDINTKYAASTAPKHLRRRDVKQESYELILAMSETQAKIKLTSLGLLPSMACRKCFKCGSAMRMSPLRAKTALKCSSPSWRIELLRADLAHTHTHTVVGA